MIKFFSTQNILAYTFRGLFLCLALSLLSTLHTKGAETSKMLPMGEKSAGGASAADLSYAKKTFLAELALDGVSLIFLGIAGAILFLKGDNKNQSGLLGLGHKFDSTKIEQIIFGICATVCPFLGRFAIFKGLLGKPTTPLADAYRKRIAKKRWLTDGITPFCILIPGLFGLFGIFGKKDILFFSNWLYAIAYTNFVVCFITRLILYFATPLVPKGQA